MYNISNKVIKFNEQTDEILLKKTRTWLRKRDFKREIEPLLIAEQNNAIRNAT